MKKLPRQKTHTKIDTIKQKKGKSMAKRYRNIKKKNTQAETEMQKIV